jgi:peptide/nickel transport system permease protein
MITFILRRLLFSIPVLIAASFIIFVCVSYAGDPLAEVKMRPLSSPETIALITERKHLDEPVVIRYFYWVKEAVTDQFGTSLDNQPVWDDLTRVIPHTLQLVLISELIALFLGAAVGLYSAIRQYSVFDYAATTLSFLGFALPVFWLALMLQILFTNIFLKWDVRIFYTSGLNSADNSCTFCLDRVQHLGIPIMVLAILQMAQYSRYMRASMLEVVNSDYIRTARAKGLSEQRVTIRHALRNAMIPIVTVSAINFGALIGGAIVTETIFQLDGMGPYFIQALGRPDVYQVMAWLMVTAIMVVLFNLVADVAYGFLDPRIRYD